MLFLMVCSNLMRPSTPCLILSFRDHGSRAVKEDVVMEDVAMDIDTLLETAAAVVDLKVDLKDEDTGSVDSALEK